MCRVLLLFSLVVCACYATFPRLVGRTLRVSNGGRWGKWQAPSFCPDGQFASGYKLKIEPVQGFLPWQDDTYLNGIELVCGTRYNTSGNGYNVSSGYGRLGNWKGLITCGSAGKFLTAFSLQVQSNQGNGDDTAANSVKFQCRNLNSVSRSHSIGDHGFWGSYGAWSLSCAKGSAICGLRTKLQRPQGGFSDDTALNNVEFYCCGSD
ncbi:vitelline membrane outer layer protein 1-like isoform X1 [Mytilus edulis]|uniref:vitelline membrane outer layer protein 1-like isoform X1 n=1 Tax=Mytilus edulis TaxID=6550 RepID=UPI0039EDF1B1